MLNAVLDLKVTPVLFKLFITPTREQDMVAELIGLYDRKMTVRDFLECEGVWVDRLKDSLNNVETVFDTPFGFQVELGGRTISYDGAIKTFTHRLKKNGVVVTEHYFEGERDAYTIDRENGERIVRLLPPSSMQCTELLGYDHRPTSVTSHEPLKRMEFKEVVAKGDTVKYKGIINEEGKKKYFHGTRKVVDGLQYFHWTNDRQGFSIHREDGLPLTIFRRGRINTYEYINRKYPLLAARTTPNGRIEYAYGFEMNKARGEYDVCWVTQHNHIRSQKVVLFKL